MKLSYLVDGRDVAVPVGFEGELKELINRAGGQNHLVRVTIENVQDVRTRGMNDKFHAMCRELAKEAGDGTENTVNTIKEMAKSIAVEYLGYPQLTDEEGRLQYDRDGRPRGISTAEATPSQATSLMDALRLLADQFGYEWRDE